MQKEFSEMDRLTQTKDDTDGLKGLQVKMFVPVDVSMDSTTNIFTYYKMINLKIFGRALFELWLH